MLVDMVGEAGGLEHAVLDGGAALGVLLGGVSRLCCSCGLMSGPVAISDIDGVCGFVRRSILGCPYCSTRHEFVVGARNCGNASLQSLCQG